MKNINQNKKKFHDYQKFKIRLNCKYDFKIIFIVLYEIHYPKQLETKQINSNSLN